MPVVVASRGQPPVGPPDDPALAYFAWSLEASPAVQPVADYLRSASRIDTEAVANWLSSVVRSELKPPPSLWKGTSRGPSLRRLLEWLRRMTDPDLERAPELDVPESASPAEYMASVGRHPRTIVDIRFQLDADRDSYARLEEAAYRLMLLAFIGTTDGNPDAMRWLGVLMARGNLNRRLTIAHFLGVVTGDRIGRIDLPVVDERLPATEEIIHWSELAVREPSTRRMLPELVQAYSARRESLP